MISVNGINNLDYNTIAVDEKWNDCDDMELTMHTIHAYPAKFPAFMASKAFEYARNEGVNIGKVADIFCGCGTVALEAKNHNYQFWGCDINPVATLIAKAKSNEYDKLLFEQYYSQILIEYKKIELAENVYVKANERLQYWFEENSFCELLKIYMAINEKVTEEKYLEAFRCIFSSILKAASKWLNKSIKPQVDPDKQEIDVIKKFQAQCCKFIRAIDEIEESNADIVINCDNFLAIDNLPHTDLIVTSPPYVTSYEYADLHQLSSLWLGYANDYRELRKGSIGSVYNSDDFTIDFDKLNETGKSIVKFLQASDKALSKVKSVARYFIDMQSAVEKCTQMLNKNGMIFFVVGDTEYKGVKIQNSKHLIEAMESNGYADIKIAKRTISKGICVPYRDEKGKFSTDKSKRKVYHEEFIISGRM